MNVHILKDPLIKLPHRLLLMFLLVASCFTACRQTEEQVKKGAFIYVEDGKLYHPDGREVAMWGVNLQPCLSWEYESLFALAGVPLDAAHLKKATDMALDEVQKMNCDVIRCHLTPSDFTDDKGALVETIYLDLLDYMVAEAAHRNMFVNLSLINIMSFDLPYEDPWAFTHPTVENSFLVDVDRKSFLFDKAIVEASKNFTSELLERTNPYLNTKYKDTPAIATLEVINEPLYFSYEEIKQEPYYSDYSAWLEEHELSDSEENYSVYRQQLVLNYINDFYDVIRATGDVHPVVWNCNWHRMISRHRDVFRAIAASKVEVVSFCNYQGQHIPKRPYTLNPMDLTGYDFSEPLKKAYTETDWYGWVMTPEFMKKARMVYEFEIFYNQSGYLYPAQADLFRALGVQMATMWHYSMPGYAHLRNGSHMLSLTCTPRKAASFAVAGEVFRSLPMFHAYDTASTTEKLTEEIMYSYEQNLSIYSSADSYMYSGEVSPANKPGPVSGVRRILGYESSPLVSYAGSGIYTLEISGDEIRISIEPDAVRIKPLWGKDFLAGPVTRLDYRVNHTMELHLDGWEARGCELFRAQGDQWMEQEFEDESRLAFIAGPGNYLIRKN
jgi:hypothetical protein